MSLLAVRAGGDPRQDRLRVMAAKAVPAPDALVLLGATHAGLVEPAFRSSMAGAGDKLFVHPCEVPELTALLLSRLIENLNAATSARDDVLTAVFASYGVMAIHPFENGNGRTGIDFAQYLLMVRWGQPTSPLSPPPELHRIVARIYAALDPTTDPTPIQLFAERERLHETIAGADLETLRGHHAFNCAADVFVACAQQEPS